MKAPYLSFLLLITAVNCAVNVSYSQEIGVGEWRYHTSFRRAFAVADGGDKVYCASEGGVYYYDKEDHSINRLTKAEGLSDFDISAMAFNRETNTLIVAYTNGNLDLIGKDEVYNMADIKRATSIIGSKRVNSIAFENTIAYLSCGFGLVVMDIEKKEIKDTYRIGENGDENIIQSAVHENMIYAITGNGLYFADINSANLANPDFWERDTLIPNSNGSFSFVFNYQGEVYVNFDSQVDTQPDTLYVKKGSSWQSVSALFGRKNKHFYATQEIIQVSHFDVIGQYDLNWEELNIDFVNNFAVQPTATTIDIENSEVSWVADGRKGLIKLINPWNTEVLTPQGTYSNNVFSITSNDGDVWVASGSAVGSLWSNGHNSDGVFLLTEEEWSVFNKSTLSNIDTLFDFLSVAVDPLDNSSVYFASHGNGIVNVKNRTNATVYNHTNSSLQLSEGSTESFQHVGTTALAFDQKNNLWAANSGATNILCAKDPEGNWYSFSLKSATQNKTTGPIMASSQNQIWTIFPNGQGLAIYDYNGTLAESADDRIMLVTTAELNGAIPSNEVAAVVEDLNGEIWVGTGAGVGIFRNPSDLFSESPTKADKPLVEQDGFNEYLLESQFVTAIAVDGANRKWVGTATSGVFLISEDGSEELLHFTKDNSPLIADIIKTIGINHHNGEVFFGTEEGICSYKSSATGGNEDYSNIYAYPNPVLPEYDGEIAITGLVSQSIVKITDLGGSLIYETVSEGGQAVWNGRNQQGNRVKTGVYLVFCATESGDISATTKILFIN